jgi:hypothetical protein
MTKLIVSACAAALIGVAASSASAGDFTIPLNAVSGGLLQVHDSRYGHEARYYDWRRPTFSPRYGYGWGGGHGDDRVLPRRAIVRQLAWHRYTRISEPQLAGRYYQVKAVDPRGRKVKLYINAYTGEIARRKFRG